MNTIQKIKHQAILAVRPLIAGLVLLSSTALVAQSWGDTGAQGIRESASTALFSPGRNAFDDNSNTAWQLTPGSTSGWVELYASSAQRFGGASITASIPNGTQLSIRALYNNAWVTIPGGVVSGPLDGIVKLVFPGEQAPTARLLIALDGTTADQAQIREVQMTSGAVLAPFGKILPKSYTTNFNEYINIKASRLWDGVIGNAWYEPLWNIPYELMQTNNANKPTAIFPPYMGQPTVTGQIIWQLDGTYTIETLKAYLINPGRSIRFEFWQNGQWTAAQDLKNQWTSGWQRLQLATPVTTNQIRITFPAGWEFTRFLGELEVWGQGFADIASRPLVISAVGSDGFQHFTLSNVDAGNYLIKAIVPGSVSALTGEWNGEAIVFAAKLVADDLIIAGQKPRQRAEQSHPAGQPRHENDRLAFAPNAIVDGVIRQMGRPRDSSLGCKCRPSALQPEIRDEHASASHSFMIEPEHPSRLTNANSMPTSDVLVKAR